MRVLPPVTRLSSVLSGVVLALVWAGTGRADITFSGSGSDGLNPANTLQAQVTFSVSGNELVIDLTNTATFKTLDPQDVLTAVYFDISGKPTLTNPTAVVGPGSKLFETPSQTTLTAPSSLMLASTPGGWDYETGSTGSVSQYYGFGTAGLDRFAGGTSSGGNGGPGNYGIAQNVTYTSFSGYLKNDKKSSDLTPLVSNTIQFTLTGLPTGFNLSSISDVRFQYGTSNSEPSFAGIPQVQLQSVVPEPSTLVVAALGALGFIGYGLRTRSNT